MTRMLASVSNLEEAIRILPCGVDIIDIKDPARGALGAVDPGILRIIVKSIDSRVITSATIGDLPMQAPVIAAGIDKVLNSGADIVKIGIFSSGIPADVMHLIRARAKEGCRLVLVFFADLYTPVNNFQLLSDLGVYGVMLDTADKTNGTLRTILNQNELESFIHTAQAAGLMTGLAGSLQQRDIRPLLEIHPDYLGFRSALCIRHQRKLHIDLNAVYAIRSMIPITDKNTEETTAMAQEV